MFEKPAVYKNFIIYSPLKRFFVSIGIFISNNWKFLVIILTILISIAAIFWMVIIRRRKNDITVKLRRKDISEVVVHELLVNLMKDVVKNIDRMEKRRSKKEFDDEERQIISNLKDSVAYVERAIDREIERLKDKK
jgi:hypothetical protein